MAQAPTQSDDIVVLAKEAARDQRLALEATRRAQRSMARLRDKLATAGIKVIATDQEEVIGNGKERADS